MRCGRFAIALLLLLACATKGREFNADAVPLVRPGVTTEVRVLELFGHPTSQRVQSSGASVWKYFYEETRTQGTGTLTRIGRAIASIFGIRAWMLPVDLEYSNTTSHALEIEFDPEGTVVDYTYEVKEKPTRRVY